MIPCPGQTLCPCKARKTPSHFWIMEPGGRAETLIGLAGMVDGSRDCLGIWTLPPCMGYCSERFTVFLGYKMHFPPSNLGGKWGCVSESKCSLPGSLGAGGGQCGAVVEQWWSWVTGSGSRATIFASKFFFPIFLL